MLAAILRATVAAIFAMGAFVVGSLLGLLVLAAIIGAVVLATLHLLRRKR